MRRLLLITAMLLASTLGARAETACDKPRNDFDGVYCLSKIYQQADQDLNSSYTKLGERLDAREQERLRTGQLAWLRSRDKECSRHEPEGFYVNLACATKATIARSHFLEDRYRECLSTGCLDSRLSAAE
jgi:uncharacterized protein YecT (DUF1311 family)